MPEKLIPRADYPSTEAWFADLDHTWCSQDRAGNCYDIHCVHCGRCMGVGLVACGCQQQEATR